MILLDTDHVTLLRYTDDPRCARLLARLRESPDRHLATSIVTFEEQMRGWMPEIKRRREFHEQVVAYDRLAEVFDFFKKWQLLPFDARAANECRLLQQQKVRIGTQDLKIAAIALVHNALLLSVNLRDFDKVPGLRVENWLA